MPAETTTSAKPSPAQRRQQQRSLKGYAITVVILAILGLISTSSITSVSHLNDHLVVQSQWRSPQSPHRVSALPPYMRPTDPEGNHSDDHDVYDPDLDFDRAHLPQSVSSQTSSTMFSRFFSSSTLFPPSQNVSQFQRPLSVQCVHSAILTVVAGVPSILRQFVGLRDWCVFLSVPYLDMYPENHPFFRHFALPSDIVSAENVIVLNASFIASLPYDTAKLFASRSNSNTYADDDDASTSEVDPNGNETSSTSEDKQQTLSTRAVAQDTSALITVHNIAYLLAVHQGSQDILEIWPDLQVESSQNLTQLITFSNNSRIPLAHNSHMWFNPHPHFLPHSMYTMQSRAHSWPRGLPLTQAWSDAASSTGISLNVSERYSNSTPVIDDEHIGIITALIDINPDVDATLTMATDQLPLIFQRHSDADIAIPLGRFAPLSSACTVWRKSAFPLLFLPPRAPVRMIDILRGFIAQRAMHASGQHVLYRAPVGVRMHGNGIPRVRNEDIEYDTKLSSMFESIMPYLHAWTPQGNATLAQYSLDLLRTLSYSNIIGYEDVSAAAKWLDDLRRVISSDDAFTIPLDEPAAYEARQAKHAYSHITRDSAISKGPNVALCVAGDIESLHERVNVGNSSVASPNGWSPMGPNPWGFNLSAGQILWQNLIVRMSSPDVFVIASGSEPSSHTKSNSSASACDLLRPPFSTSFLCTQRSDKEAENDWSSTVWKRLEATSREFYRNAGHLRSRHACKSAIDRSVRQNGTPAYDWVMYIDTGVLVDPLPGLQMLSLNQRADVGVVWTSSPDDIPKNVSQPYLTSICSRLNRKSSNSTVSSSDHGFFFGHWKQMSTWLNTLELLMVAHDTSRNSSAWSVDDSIRDVLAHNGVAVKTHPMIVTCPLPN